jgi:hypothetical protein
LNGETGDAEGLVFSGALVKCFLAGVTSGAAGEQASVMKKRKKSGVSWNNFFKRAFSSQIRLDDE